MRCQHVCDKLIRQAKFCPETLQCVLRIAECCPQRLFDKNKRVKSLNTGNVVKKTRTHENKRKRCSQWQRRQRGFFWGRKLGCERKMKWIVERGGGGGGEITTTHFREYLSTYHFFCLSCLVLSCLVLSCLVLSCLVLSCLVLSCLVLSCLVLSCLVLSCLVLYFRVSSCLVLSCLVLSSLVLSGLVLSCLGLSCGVLRCVGGKSLISWTELFLEISVDDRRRNSSIQEVRLLPPTHHNTPHETDTQINEAP